MNLSEKINAEVVRHCNLISVEYDVPLSLICGMFKVAVVLLHCARSVE
jgi:hypothetical protein